jgi:hypothetical protein
MKRMMMVLKDVGFGGAVCTLQYIVGMQSAWFISQRTCISKVVICYDQKSPKRVMG